MSPYVGEIRLFAGNFAPSGWAFCNGALLPIDANYDPLFELIGTTYGGDGQTTFALPDLRSRVPMHLGTNSFGSTYLIGQQGGVETVTLATQNIPAHTHALRATTAIGTQTSPGGNLLANSQGPQPYIQESADAALNAQALGLAGGSQPHQNLQPLLCINFILSLYGNYPSPT
jgi:microcystin-dependent protein